jgi:hypothetical protein
MNNLRGAGLTKIDLIGFLDHGKGTFTVLADSVRIIPGDLFQTIDASLNVRFLLLTLRL